MSKLMITLLALAAVTGAMLVAAFATGGASLLLECLAAFAVGLVLQLTLRKIRRSR